MKKRRRSRSKSLSDEERGRPSGRRRSRSRSLSPRDRRSEKVRSDGGKGGKEKSSGINYAKLIEGYDTMVRIIFICIRLFSDVS